MDPHSVDFIVIGAGMAGVSVAAELSRYAAVAVVERESQPGYHATGRSAAHYSELYGNAVIRALTRASRSFYFSPPAGFSASPLVTLRDTLYFVARDEVDTLDRAASQFQASERPTRLDAALAHASIPAFAPGYLGGALLEQGSADIDVAAVLQGFVVQCRRQGVRMLMEGPVQTVAHHRDGWVVTTSQAELHAPVVINAAGAWGDEVARLAGVRPAGLVPKRRTAVTIDVPGGLDAARWPAAVHAAETFYFKPDAGLLLISPADETPSAPCDAQPDELDVAIAVERFEQAIGKSVPRLRSRWAGLRTFMPDKTPLVGFDPLSPGFFWLVGQGGYGIQTAPAMARVASALARRVALDPDLQGVATEVGSMAPVAGRMLHAGKPG